MFLEIDAVVARLLKGDGLVLAPLDPNLVVAHLNVVAGNLADVGATVHITDFPGGLWMFLELAGEDVLVFIVKEVNIISINFMFRNSGERSDENSSSVIATVTVEGRFGFTEGEFRVGEGEGDFVGVAASENKAAGPNLEITPGEAKSVSPVEVESIVGRNSRFALTS